MVRLAIIDKDGKTVLPKDLATAGELRQVVDQARNLIRECEQLAQLKGPKAQGQGVPYL